MKPVSMNVPPRSTIRRRLGDTRGVAASLMGLGMASMRTVRFEQGRTALQESVAAWRACGDRRSMAGALSQMAALWTWMGPPERGCSYSLEASTILHDLGLPMWLAVEQCCSVSEPYLHSGRYVEAKEIVEAGLTIARHHKIPWPTGAGLVRLAKLAIARTDYADAIDLLQESIPILRSIERVDELGDALICLATSSFLSGELEKVRTHLIEGKQIAADIGHFATVCHAAAASALLSRMQGNTELAAECCPISVNQPFVASSRWFADVYGTARSPIKKVTSDSAAKTTNDSNCTSEKIRAICEIRGSCSGVTYK